MRKIIIASFFMALFLMQQDAHAYINPGTGSDFFQMLVGIVLGIAKFFKKIVGKIKSIFGFKSNKDNSDEK